MQRAMIVDALLSSPKLLIADNITMPLDVTVAAQIIKLMEVLRDKFNTAIIFSSSSLPVVREITDNLIIIKNAFNTSPNFQKAYPNSAIGWGTMYKCYPEGHTNYYTQAQGLHSIAISGSKKIYVHSCIESNGTPETTIFNLD